MAVPGQGFEYGAVESRFADLRFMSLVGNCKFKDFAAQMTTHDHA
jgi:hypothetical protein